MLKGKFFILWLLLIFSSVGSASAHGLYGYQNNDKSLVLYFEYSEGEPAAYAAVSVFSPSDEKFEYQKARSDQNGYFAFRPNEAGSWKIVLDDAQGHQSQVAVEVPADFFKSEKNAEFAIDVSEHAAKGPTPINIILGLSVLLNLFLLALYYRRCRQTKAGA